jgi:hypothetical protein
MFFGVIFKIWQNFQNMAKLVKLAPEKKKNLQKFPQFFFLKKKNIGS